MSKHITRHLKISGRVQGVGFRYHFTRAARALGITGWVRNRRDGSVEAMVSGPAEAVEEATAWARHGPSKAQVQGVEVADSDGNFDAFETLPTE